MNTRSSLYPRSHALLGDALHELPDGFAATLEEQLCHAAESAPPPVFFSTLDDLGHGRCADGQPWQEAKLSPKRELDMARASRNASGASALVAVLHAAHVAREDGGAGSYLQADLVDSLFRACAALTETTEHCLGH